jgi:hypothetical protein
VDERAPDSWRRYPIWAAILSRASLVCGALAVPLCTVLPLWLIDEFWLSSRLSTATGEFPGSLAASWAVVGGPCLALFAALGAAVVFWLNPGISAPPRLTRLALILGLVGLGLSVLAVVAFVVAVVQAGGME